MTGRIRDGLAAAVAVVAVAVAVWCWTSGVTTSDFAPILEGAPGFTATHYSGPWIGAAGVAVAVAGLALIDVWRRHWRGVPKGGILRS